MLRKRLDPQVFEDKCRGLLGNNGYVLFTFDKLLERITKKLHSLVGSEADRNLLLLYLYEHSRRDRCVRERQYFANALLHADLEVVYRVEYVPGRACVEVRAVDLARMTWDALGARVARREGARARELLWWVSRGRLECG